MIVHNLMIHPALTWRLGSLLSCPWFPKTPIDTQLVISFHSFTTFGETLSICFDGVMTTTISKQTKSQLSNTKITLSPLKNILLMKRSLFKGLPLFPPANLGISVHISLTFSSTMLQWRSNALTRARSFRLFRQDISTWVWDLTAVCRIERGPEVNSCSSIFEISYSL